MTCPRCQHLNRREAAFCAECGARLAIVCPGCGGALQPGAKFCDACGKPAAAQAGVAARSPHTYTPKHLAERILTSRGALEGERKQVTVLFVYVHGSMRLARQVDAEEWHRIMDRFFTVLAEGVHRFEGTVNQFTGDGIMALFGAPLAHEDHARRACYAALHLAEALGRYAGELRRKGGLNFTVRMGLNSGEVVVGKIGDDLRMDYTAHGHTVGLAARMEQLAEAGRIYHEFAERCRARGIPVHEAHAVAHGMMVPLVPVLEYLRGYFGIAGPDPPQAAREKIAGRLLLLDPELVDGLPLLFDLLGVPDPENPTPPGRSEEHTSELQSPDHLVCRLLLEKKNM